MAVVSRRGNDFDQYAQAFRFSVVFKNWPSAATPEVPFARVTGISSSVDITEYREGDDPITNLKFPGLLTFDDVTFERGIVKGDILLVEFFSRVAELNFLFDPSKAGADEPTTLGSPIRTDVSIKVYSRNKGSLIREIVLHNAFPSQLSIGDLDASSGDILIETLVMAHEGFAILRPKAPNNIGVV